MTLIIETGEGLANANSYATVAELQEYALMRGETLPTEGQEVLLVKAMDYLEQFTATSTPAYKGVPLTNTQALQWPRTGAVSGPAIPRQLKAAQCQLAIEAIDYDLMPSNDGFAVAREQVDVLEVEYATGGRLSGKTMPATPTFPKVKALLDPLMRIGIKLRSVRI